jgi:hypothetical protein
MCKPWGSVGTIAWISLLGYVTLCGLMLLAT